MPNISFSLFWLPLPTFLRLRNVKSASCSYLAGEAQLFPAANWPIPDSSSLYIITWYIIHFQTSDIFRTPVTHSPSPLSSAERDNLAGYHQPTRIFTRTPRLGRFPLTPTCRIKHRLSRYLLSIFLRIKEHVYRHCIYWNRNKVMELLCLAELQTATVDLVQLSSGAAFCPLLSVTSTV